MDPVVAVMAHIHQVLRIKRDRRIRYVLRCQLDPVMDNVPKLFPALLAHTSVPGSPLADICLPAFPPGCGKIKLFCKVPHRYPLWPLPLIRSCRMSGALTRAQSHAFDLHHGRNAQRGSRTGCYHVVVSRRPQSGQQAVTHAVRNRGKKRQKKLAYKKTPVLRTSLILGSHHSCLPLNT